MWKKLYIRCKYCTQFICLAIIDVAFSVRSNLFRQYSYDKKNTESELNNDEVCFQSGHFVQLLCSLHE